MPAKDYRLYQSENKRCQQQLISDGLSSLMIVKSIVVNSKLEELKRCKSGYAMRDARRYEKGDIKNIYIASVPQDKDNGEFSEDRIKWICCTKADINNVVCDYAYPGSDELFKKLQYENTKGHIGRHAQIQGVVVAKVELKES